ncbi:MAG: dihydropteroate synthase, partial [Deltaproteobacteria bacterium]|nr:dihydropteroate synthase [Deltaproteobacteria bacterium]
MERIGVDPAGAAIMAPKQFHYNLKVNGLTPAQANIIKQEILSCGGEAAVSKDAASCSVPSTDAVISGTARQFARLIEKLGAQPYGLKPVAEDLREALDNAKKGSFVIRTAEREWTLGERTLIMGVLNITPDSFYDKGRFLEKEKAIEGGLKMAEEGADWIDVGGESTRPGASSVDEGEELKRVIPVIEALSSKGLTVSVDTSKAIVAGEAIKAGAGIVNDISGMTDPRMAGVSADAGVPVVIMHMRGTPQTMQDAVEYKDLSGEVFDYLLSRIRYALKSGINPENIIIDPGIGFGKSREGNLELIRNLSCFKTLGRPVLVGPSRKSFIGRTLDRPAGERLSGTLAVLAAAVLNGAHILRVHDVPEARDAARMADAIKNSGAHPPPIPPGRRGGVGGGEGPERPRRGRRA